MIRNDEYMASQVMTAPPHQLHMLVVDGAIRFARQGRQALQDEDVETAHIALGKSRDCVSELISGLDEEQSPELTDQLKGLFFYAYRNLVQADIDRELQMIDDALRVLEVHRETWQALTDRLSQERIIPEPKTPAMNAEMPSRSWTT